MVAIIDLEMPLQKRPPFSSHKLRLVFLQLACQKVKQLGLPSDSKTFKVNFVVVMVMECFSVFQISMHERVAFLS